MVERVRVVSGLGDVMFDVELSERYVHIATMRNLIFYRDSEFHILWESFKSLADEDDVL